MSLIEYTIDGKIDKAKQAITRIKSFNPITNGFMDTPYYVAYSGGKDSDVIRILCELAGVKHDLVHNHTTVDAPETVYYIRSIPNVQISSPHTSMWKLIVEKGFPPIRTKRYCCSELKERGGKDRFVMTGVRWAESVQRSSRGSIEIQGSSKKTGIVLNADNDENRRHFETCTKKGKRMINPIIDWEDNDVWEFLNHYGCKSNPLYQCGYSRIGCIGCPLARKARDKEFSDYPKYKGNYIKAFQRMLNEWKCSKTFLNNWASGESIFDWWMRDENLDEPIEGQIEWEDVADAD